MSNSKRARPPEHQGKELDTLDEMESAAKNRVINDGRAAISGKLKLEWRDKEKGFHYYWGSDSPTTTPTLQEFCENGYEFVRSKHGQHAGNKIIKSSKGCSLYLMRIPDKLHEENMRLEAQKVDRSEKELLHVGEREYAGESKELGKGQAVIADYTESPLMGN